MKRYLKWITAGVIAAAPFAAHCSDYADAPLVESDQAADIADVYAFLDPNNNQNVILAMDVHAFIVPGENGNLGAFDPNVLFQFNIENTGDAAPDKLIQITFDAQTSKTTPQTAHITIPAKKKKDSITFTAPTTVASGTAASAPTATVTTDPATGIIFFAGLTDDPFFFDVPAFNNFVASVLAGAPNAAVFARGRDTFAGYNVQMITLSVPASLLTGSAGSVIGVSATTLRKTITHLLKNADPKSSGAYLPVDRAGVPAINTAFIPFARKNEYNRSTTVDDANGKFANDIVATLHAFGTDDVSVGILADIAINKGDMLRLDTAVANTGTNTQGGFPNGRRPSDDVMDTILTLINNGTTLTDNVAANDAPFRTVFPFFASPHQPSYTTSVDDGTRN
jgi:hypothetical protein